MRLHRLDVTAFGPFAGTETGRLRRADRGRAVPAARADRGRQDQRARRGLLRAVRRGARAPASRAGTCAATTPPPDVRPEVVLDVTVARPPARDHPLARRGSDPSAAAPARPPSRPAPWCANARAGEWVELTSRNDEAGQLVGSLIGMNASQFTQVVLLPQGQFAEFLRADAEARRVMLEQLFDTRRFSDVEAWLADQRRVLDRAVAAADQTIGELLARVAEAAGAASRPRATRTPAAWLDALGDRGVARSGRARRHAANQARARRCEQPSRPAATPSGWPGCRPATPTRVVAMAGARRRRARAASPPRRAGRRPARRRHRRASSTRCVAAPSRLTEAASARRGGRRHGAPAAARRRARAGPAALGRQGTARGGRADCSELARDADELARVRAELAADPGRAGRRDATARCRCRRFLAGADEHRTCARSASWRRCARRRRGSSRPS